LPITHPFFFFAYQSVCPRASQKDRHHKSLFTIICENGNNNNNKQKC